MLPFLTRIHPDPKQPCFPICSIAGLRSSNAGTENETTQAELLDKMLGVFTLSLATIFPTHPYSKVCTSFPSIARNTCGQRQPILLMSKFLKNSGKHRTFTRSWQTPSLTVLALRCCSDNLIQNLQKRAPLKRQRDSKLDSKCNF